MLSVGLTGGIGSGKTTVAHFFSELGVPVYNADLRARALMNLPALRTEVQKTFGIESYKDGELNRPYLASIVFGNQEKLQLLNSIVHPVLQKDYIEWLKQQKGPYAIREAAILFESGANKNCDLVISVSASEQIRIRRVINRDGMKEDEVRKRIESQWTDEERNRLSDYVIPNEGGEDLRALVSEIHEEIVKHKANSK